MIYDCFSFFNELDVLEIRLNTLNDVVDKFVLVEASFTHTGHNKDFFFEANKSRFSEFLDKIVHIKLDEMPSQPSCGTKCERRWFLENYQRNQISRGLCDASADDIIMISDCDEIPEPSIVATLPKLSGISRFKPRAYNFYLNLRNCTAPFFEHGTTAISYATFLRPDIYRVFPYQEFVPKCYNKPPTATLIRYIDPDRCFRAGWHFSYLGGADAISAKIHSTADGNDWGLADMPLAEIEQRICRGEDIFGRGDRFFPELVDISFPEVVQRKQEHFARLICPVTASEFSQLRLRRWKEMLRGAVSRFPQTYLYPAIGPIRRRLKRRFCQE